MMNPDHFLRDLLSGGAESSDPAKFRKIRALNVFQLAFITLAPFLGLFYFFIGAVALFYATILAGLLMVSSLLLVRKSGHLVLSGNYALFILWATVFVIGWQTGAITYEGVPKPLWIMNGGLLLFAIFLNGYPGGTIWATVIFLEMGFVIYLFRNGYPFPNVIPPEISTVYSLGTYMISLLTILVLAFLFEREKDEAALRERGKSLALMESKRYIDDILERSPIATFVLDRRHRVIQWNRACEEMTGISPGAVLGKAVWEGFRADARGSLADILLDDPQAIGEEYKEFIHSQTDSGWFELEVFLPGLKGGTQAFITVSTVLDQGGKVKGAIQTVREASAGTEDAMGLDLAGGIGGSGLSLGHPVFKINAQGKISFWNDACEGLFGYKAPEMVGSNAMALVAKKYRPDFKETVLRAFKGEFFAGREWKYSSREGQPVYVLGNVYLARSSDGKRKECVVFNTDITDLKLKLKKLGVYAAESREKLKGLSEEHALLKKNIAAFIRGKGHNPEPPPD